jgi:tellurite resistance protein TerB
MKSTTAPLLDAVGAQHMLGLMKNWLGDAQASYAKFNDKETAEGIIAVMVGTAYADGELEPAEKDKIVKALRVNPILKQFDQSTLIAKFNELDEQCQFDAGVGQDACIKELREAAKGATEEKRIAIGRMGVAAAKADGEVEPDEVTFLRRAADALGVSPSQIGL